MLCLFACRLAFHHGVEQLVACKFHKLEVAEVALRLPLSRLGIIQASLTSALAARSVRVLPPLQYQDAVGRLILRSTNFRGTYCDTPTVCPPVAPDPIKRLP